MTGGGRDSGDSSLLVDWWRLGAWRRSYEAGRPLKRCQKPGCSSQSKTALTGTASSLFDARLCLAEDARRRMQLALTGGLLLSTFQTPSALSINREATKRRIEFARRLKSIIKTRYWIDWLKIIVPIN